MKITILGSSAFRKEKVEFKRELLKIGHEPIIDEYTEKLAAGEMPELLDQIHREHSKAKRQYDFINWYYDAILRSDAIVVINLDKKGIKNYIGANTFLEMGYAHFLKKKIFLLNDKPNQDYIKDEIDAMDIILLNGSINNI